MSRWRALAWLGGGRAVENARTASAELCRLRAEREEIGLYLEEWIAASTGAETA